MSPFHMSEATMDDYLELFHKFRIRYLYGIPSAIAILAEHGLKRDWKAPNSLRGVMPASETLFDHQRKIMHECFGVPIMAHYGMSERVAFAGEVLGRPGTYEFEPLYGLAEVVNDAGEPISVPGQRGRLVSTGFCSRSMALIRYETGDRVTLVENAAHENYYRLRVCDIRSRWNQEFVIGRNGERISAINLDQENHFGFIKEYQYAQSVPGEVVMRIVPCNGVRREELEALMKPTRAHVEGIIDLKLEIVPSIPVGSTGKRAFVDQRIPSLND
jgi:phenylacetate-CoA ligase